MPKETQPREENQIKLDKIRENVGNLWINLMDQAQTHHRDGLTNGLYWLCFKKN